MTKAFFCDTRPWAGLWPAALALGLVLLLWPAGAAADLVIDWGGRVQTDLRFRVQEVGTGTYYNRVELPAGISRNENILKVKINASYGDVGAVAEVDLVLYGHIQQLEGIGSLSLREDVDPYRFEAHALYVEAFDLFLDGLDLRAGQQVVSWGVGDQFNPTNTLNPLDLEDPLLFGEMLATPMVKLDYSVNDDWSITGIMIPVFRPSLLPTSGKLALADTSRMPFVSDGLRHRVNSEKTMSETFFGMPTVVSKVQPVEPEISFENIQWAARVSGLVADQDIALSYHYGRSDIPQPYINVSRAVSEKTCDPAAPASAPVCTKGHIATDVYLTYPRMHVVGLNMAGQIPLDWISDSLKALGYRLEVGLFFPQPVSLVLMQATAVLTQPAGEYPYGEYAGADGRRPEVVSDTPFVKWVFGLDYTLNQHVYVNAQWVHGFPGEYGAGDFFTEGWTLLGVHVDPKNKHLLSCGGTGDGTKCAEEVLRPRLGDYLVFGLDFKFLSDRLLLRLFTIWDLSGVHLEKYNEDTGQREREHRSMFTSEGFSAIIYPELNFQVGGGFELGAGALLTLGGSQTKFGDPQVGGHQIWSRARFSW